MRSMSACWSRCRPPARRPRRRRRGLLCEPVYRADDGPQARREDALVDTDSPAHDPVGSLDLDIGGGLGVGARRDRVFGVVENLCLDVSAHLEAVHERGDGAVSLTLNRAMLTAEEDLGGA